MTAAGPSTGRSSAATPNSPCDNCNLLDDTMTLLRKETERRGFPTPDGMHMGPCEVYRNHSHTIGPDGSLYACPGFTGEFALAVGHIDGRREPCAVAAHAELGDMDAPSCHKRSLESALESLAETAAGNQAGEVQ